MRKAFNSTERKKFLQDLAQDDDTLKRAGLTDSDIARMKDGLNPKGCQVHHKLPLDDGRTNALDNLILIKNDPYHKTITNFQNTFAKQLDTGDTKIIEWPIPEGNIYP
ncbi:HNH endonuclease signature motif containing protein, partial [Clostridium perfringens]|uniref:HNH endonuclease signature motif containing protein n=1 Tax=Clostridium perfringens TaxID=1502 RepID=UPI002ACBEE68